MVGCYPSTPVKKAATAGCFLAGAALFLGGLHLAYVNVGPQQARTKARADFIRETLRRRRGIE